MASASSLGLPQPPVAVQTATQAGGVGVEWNNTTRPTFWNGVANEAVFEKDTAHKGRAMGLASAGTLALVPTPTQTNGIEDTYSKPLNAGTGQATFPASITTKVDTYSFDVSTPVASVIVPNTTPLWASNLTFSRKRARLGGDGAGTVSTTPLFTVADTAPIAGVNTTSADGVAPTLTFNCPVVFSGGGGGTVVNAVGAPTPLTAAQTSGDAVKQFSVTAQSGPTAPLPNDCNGLTITTASASDGVTVGVVSTAPADDLVVSSKGLAGTVAINESANGTALDTGAVCIGGMLHGGSRANPGLIRLEPLTGIDCNQGTLSEVNSISSVSGGGITITSNTPGVPQPNGNFQVNLSSATRLLGDVVATCTDATQPYVGIGGTVVSGATPGDWTKYLVVSHLGALWYIPMTNVVPT